MPHDISIFGSTSGVEISNDGINLNSGLTPFYYAHYMRLPYHTDFDFGTGDFTLEMYLTFNVMPGGSDYLGLLAANLGGGDPGKWMWGIWLNKIQFTNASTYPISYTHSLVINTKYHLAIVKSGTTIYLFIDGVLTASSINETGVWNCGADGFSIGRLYPTTDGYYLNAKIHNIGIHKGIARWTSGFIPTNTITNDSYTVFAFNPESDSSTFSKSIKVYGKAIMSTSGKFGSGYYIDASTPSSYIESAAGNEWDFGTGDFTIDFWMKTTNTSQVTWNCVGTYPSTNFNFDWRDGVYNYWIYWNGGGSLAVRGTNASINDGNWHHHAVVRSSGYIYYYVDGIAQSTDTSNAASGTIGNNSVPMRFGTQYANTYFDELRISKGIARWTSNFTPPAAPY
jgi:hypothetical protein